VRALAQIGNEPDGVETKKGENRGSLPLSCTPSVVMQKASQRPNSTEKADGADAAEIAQAAYFL
jgi:hypothetical protein